MGHQRPARPAQPPAQRQNPENSPAALAIIEHIKYRKNAIRAIIPNPERFGADRMIALVFQSLRVQPRLLECTQASVLASIFNAAKVGLEPDTPRAHCHLIPYRREATFVLGYQGGKVLAARRGEIVKVHTDHVFEADERAIERGARPVLHHVPSDKRDRGAHLGTYAVATFRDPQIDPLWVYMTRAQLDDIEAFVHKCKIENLDRTRERMVAEKATNASLPWIRWRDRQWAKTAIKRLCKEAIDDDESGEATKLAVALDDLADAGKSQAGVGGELPAPDDPGTITQLDEGDAHEREVIAGIEDCMTQLVSEADDEILARARTVYREPGPLADKWAKLAGLVDMLSGGMPAGEQAIYDAEVEVRP